MTRRDPFLVGMIRGMAMTASFFIIMTFRPAPRADSPMTQGAYIWQRQWDDSLRQAIGQHADRFDHLIILAGEVRWSDRRMHFTPVKFDSAALIATGQPVALAIRVNPYHGSFDPDAPACVALIRQVESLLGQATSTQLPADEIQLDFDAATSQLDGYRQWLEAVRPHLPAGVKLTITALPTWLTSSRFDALARATDGYVLQVHSLVLPKKMDEPLTLCDVKKAVRWVEQAGAINIPFDVALPTYGYVLAFDGQGKYLGLTAEDADKNWPGGTRLKVVRADADAMADLVKTFSRSRPEAMGGVIWYRLPIDRDWLNWRWPTLEAVMTGQRPIGHHRIVTTYPKPGLVDVELTNDGQANQSLEVVVEVTWRGAGPLAADGLAGYRWQALSENGGRFVPTARLNQAVLGPSMTHPIGWIRFEHDTEVECHVRKTSSVVPR